MKNKLWTIGIGIIVVIALGLRLWGIEWGLPNALHACSYHTDETVILLICRPAPNGLNIFAGQILPHFYNYGSLQLYLNNIAISIVNAYAPGAHSSADYTRLITVDYLVCRLLTAFMGAATVWALGALGRRLYGDVAGLIAALLLAVTPLHAQHSHFMTVDVPATLWVVLSLLWCAKAQTDERRLRALIFAGIFVGFAAATKYNCAIAILPVMYACFAKSEHPTKLRSVGEIVVAAVAVAAAYLIGCPGTLLENAKFLQDFQFEAAHVSSQQELWFQGYGAGWLYIMTRNLADGLGVPLLSASVAGLVYAGYKRSFGDIMLVLFVLPYYFVVSTAVSRYARYEIPILPILALLAARLLGDFSTNLSPKWSLAGRIVAGAVTASALVSTIFLLIPMSQTDPRDLAAEWINKNVPTSSQIAMPTDPWFWSAPIDRYFCLPGVGEWHDPRYDPSLADQIVPDYTMTDPRLPFDNTVLTSFKPAIVTMSEFEYYDRLRLKDQSTLAYLSVLRQSYSAPMVFKSVHWLGGSRSIDGLPCQDLPIDMLYASPTVLVFRRD